MTISMIQMIFVTCFWHQFWWSVRFSWPGHRTMAISPRYGDYKNCERVGSTKARVNMFQSCRRSQMKDSTCIWKVNESKRFGTNVVTHDFHSIFMYLSYLVCSKRSLQRSHWMSVHPKRGMASWARTWSAVLPPAPGERFAGCMDMFLWSQNELLQSHDTTHDLIRYVTNLWDVIDRIVLDDVIQKLYEILAYSHVYPTSSLTK